MTDYLPEAAQGGIQQELKSGVAYGLTHSIYVGRTFPSKASLLHDKVRNAKHVPNLLNPISPSGLTVFQRVTIAVTPNVEEREQVDKIERIIRSNPISLRARNRVVYETESGKLGGRVGPAI